MDDLTCITETVRDNTEHDFAETNDHSWLCQNIKNLGAFKFEILLNTPIFDVDKYEKKAMQASIVRLVGLADALVNIDWEKGQTRVYTKFKLGMYADKHIEAVLLGARHVLDAFQKF